MANSGLPPSKFGAGYTAGQTLSAAAAVAPGAVPAGRVNRLAAVTFGAALLLGLVVAPFTLPLSYLAQRQVRSSGEAGAGLARAASMISGVYIVIGFVVVGLYFYLAGFNPPQ